jgi:hypothetical protein
MDTESTDTGVLPYLMIEYTGNLLSCVVPAHASWDVWNKASGYKHTWSLCVTKFLLEWHEKKSICF